jgi:hypothetical protein
LADADISAPALTNGFPSTSELLKPFKNIRRSGVDFVPEPGVLFQMAGETESGAENNDG